MGSSQKEKAPGVCLLSIWWRSPLDTWKLLLWDLKDYSLLATILNSLLSLWGFIWIAQMSLLGLRGYLMRERMREKLIVLDEFISPGPGQPHLMGLIELLDVTSVPSSVISEGFGQSKRCCRTWEGQMVSWFLLKEREREETGVFEH